MFYMELQLEKLKKDMKTVKRGNMSINKQNSLCQ